MRRRLQPQRSAARAAQSLGEARRLTSGDNDEPTDERKARQTSFSCACRTIKTTDNSKKMSTAYIRFIVAFFLLIVMFVCCKRFCSRRSHGVSPCFCCFPGRVPRSCRACEWPFPVLLASLSRCLAFVSHAPLPHSSSTAVSASLGLSDSWQRSGEQEPSRGADPVQRSAKAAVAVCPAATSRMAGRTIAHSDVAVLQADTPTRLHTATAAASTRTRANNSNLASALVHTRSRSRGTIAVARHAATMTQRWKWSSVSHHIRARRASESARVLTSETRPLFLCFVCV